MKDAWEALSDKTRREILELLRSRPHTAGEIADQFSLSASTVSHHLSVLKQGGFIRSQKRAQTIIYSLNTAAFQEIMKFVSGFIKK